MAKSTPAQAAKDEKDVFEQTAEATFTGMFGGAGGKTSTPSSPLIAAASSGKEDTAAFVPKEPGTNSFSDWWAKDSTQEKFHGVMGSITSMFGGMAGMPLGGSDMSSMERAAVRAQGAPGRARQMIKEKQFNRYIDSEMGKAVDPQRKDMLQAIRMDPTNSRYLAAESPGSKREREQALASAKHGYKMAEIALKNEGLAMGGGVTPNRADDIGTANEMYKSLTEEEQTALSERGEIPFRWFEITNAINLIPHLYSPGRGALSSAVKGPTPDLAVGGDEEVGGETITLDEKVLGWIHDQWDSMTEASRQWWESLMKMNDLEMSPEEKAARKEAGLE